MFITQNTNNTQNTQNTQNTMRCLSLLLSLVFWLSSACYAASIPACGPSCRPPYDFAIMNMMPNDQAAGIAQFETVCLHAMMIRFGWTYKDVSFSDLNNGVLETNGKPQFSAFIEPGGTMIGDAARNVAISTQGYTNIRKFISDGGSYIGFCAGGFTACQNAYWAGNGSGTGPIYNLPSDYKQEPMKLQIFPGSGYGPFAWVKKAHVHELEPTRINLRSPIMQAIQAPATTFFAYENGPAFTPSNAEVWCWAQKPASITSNGLIGQGWPTIIRFAYGKGQAILFSYHPSVLAGQEIDGVSAGYINGVAVEGTNESLKGTGQAFLAHHTQQELNDVNYQSWNILHAALQVVTHQQVTKMII